MTAWRFSLVPILIAASGCDWKITSRVGVQVMAPLRQARDDGTRDVPIGAARVRVECPNRVGESLGATDASGWVLVVTRTPVGLDCNLAIDSDHRAIALIPVSETCARREAEECRVLEVRVTLDLKDEAAGPEPIALGARCETGPLGGLARCWRAAKPMTVGWARSTRPR